MEEIIKNMKYIIIYNDKIYPMKNYNEISDFIHEKSETKITTMLISRRFKEKNHFKINDFIMKKLIWKHTI